jgi:hypothetical protein
MSIALFFGSIFTSFIIVVVFRQLDKKNRSFDKIAKFSKNVKEELSVFTKERFQEIKDYDNSIDVSLQKGKGLLDDLNKSLKLAEQHSHILEKNKLSTLLQKIESTENEFTNISHQLKDFKENFLKEVKNEYFTINENYKEKITGIKTELSSIDSELRKKLEEKVNDYSAYIVRIENRGEELSRRLEKEIAGAKENHILDFKATFTNAVNDMEKYGDKIKIEVKNMVAKEFAEQEDRYKKLYENFKNVEVDASTKISTYENFLKDSSNYFEKLKKDTFKDIDEKVDALNIHINNANDLGVRLEMEVFNEIKVKLENFKNDTEKEIEHVNTSIAEKNKILENEINENHKISKEKLNDIEKEINTLNDNFTDRVTDLKIEVESLESKKENFKTNLIEDMEKYKIIINNNIMKSKQYFEKETEKIFHNIDKSLLNVSSEADGKTNEIKKKFDEKYNEIEINLEHVLEGMTDKERNIEGRISVRMKEIENSLVDKQNIFENEIRDLGINYELKMKNFTDEINSFIDKSNVETEQKLKFINMKVSDFNKEFTGFTDAVNEKIKTGDADFEKFVSNLLNKTNILEDDLTQKMSLIESKYFEKANNLVSNNENRLNSFENNFNNLAGKYEDLKNIFENEVTEKIESANNNIENIYNEGITNLTTNYKELENETLKKIDEYKGELSKMKQTIRILDEKYENRFNDKLGDFDGRFDTKMQMLNEKYKFSIDENVNILNSFIKKFDDLNKEVENYKAKIDSDVADKVENGKIVLNEQYKILETETIKKINDYKNELLKIRQNMQQLDDKFIQKFSDKVNDVDKKFEQKMVDFDNQYSVQKIEIEKQIDDLKSDFNKKGDSMLNENEIKLNDFVSKFNELSNNILKLKEQIDSEIEEKVQNGKEIIGNTFNDEVSRLNEKYQKTEVELENKLDDYKKEMVKLQQNMKQVDDRFTARFMEHSSILDKKIVGLEDDIKKFEKSTGIFDKAAYLRDKLSDEIKELKDQIVEIKNDKENVAELEKKMLNIESMVSASEQKYSFILNENKKLDNVAEIIIEIKKVADSVEDKIKVINDAKSMISMIENKIETTGTKVTDLEKYYNNISSKEDSIKKSIEFVETAKLKSFELSEKYDTLNKKYDDLEFKRTTFEKVFKNFEKDANFITKSESKVSDVIEKFNQMDNLIEDLESRTESINKIREWLVKAETQIENMNVDADKRIKLLDSLINKSPEAKIVKEKLKDENSKKEVIIQLKNQGWTIDDIAKTLNLSVGEVEFILDLELNKIVKKH